MKHEGGGRQQRTRKRPQNLTKTSSESSEARPSLPTNYCSSSPPSRFQNESQEQEAGTMGLTKATSRSTDSPSPLAGRRLRGLGRACLAPSGVLHTQRKDLLPHALLPQVTLCDRSSCRFRRGNGKLPPPSAFPIVVYCRARRGKGHSTVVSGGLPFPLAGTHLLHYTYRVRRI